MTERFEAQPCKFLGVFYSLADVKCSVRFEAVTALLKHLRSKRSGTESSLSTVLRYTLRRLLRGLSSSRNAARQGFSLALSEMLRFSSEAEVPTLEVIEHLECVCGIRVGSQSHSITGREERDVMFAVIFGCVSLQSSGRLYNEVSSVSVPRIVQLLVRISKKKQWARQSCYEVLLSILSCLSVRRATVEFFPHLAPLFINSSNLVAAKGDPQASCSQVMMGGSTIELCGGVKDLNTDQLQLALGLQNWLKSVTSDMHSMQNVGLASKIPEIIYSSQPLVRRGHVKLIIQALQDSASFSPGVHAVWYHLIAVVLEEEKHATPILREFWLEAVERSLMHSTKQRCALGFELFRHILPLLNAIQVPQIITPTILSCLAVNMSSPDSHLHKSAVMSVEVIIKVASKSMSMRSALVNSIALVDPYFDERCKARGKPSSKIRKRGRRVSSNEGLIKTLLNGLDEMGLEQYTLFLKGQILHPFKGPEESNDNRQSTDSVSSRRLWALNALCASTRKLAKGDNVNDDKIRRVLHFFFDCAYLLNPTISHQFSGAFRQLCAQRLFSILSGLPVSKYCNNGKWAKELYEYWISAESAAEKVFFLPLSQTQVQTAKEIDMLISKIERALQQTAASSLVYEQLVSYYSLVLHIGLALFSSTEHVAELDYSLASYIIDLGKIFDKIFDESRDEELKNPAYQAHNEKTMVLHANEDTGSIIDDSIHFYVELLLKLLEEPKLLHERLVRNVVTSAFQSICPCLSALAIMTLLRALERTHNLSISYEDDSDIVDNHEFADEESHDLCSNGSDDEGKSYLMSAKKRHLSADEGVDSDSVDNSEEESTHILKDEEYALVLERTFSVLSKTSKKKEKIILQRRELNFKLRVLALIDIYLRRQPSSIYVPQMLITFIRIFRICCRYLSPASGGENDKVSWQYLLDRLNRVVRIRILSKNEIPAMEAIVAISDILQETLQDLLSEAILAPAPLHEDIACLSAIYIMKILRTSQVLDMERLSKSLDFALLTFLRKKRSRLNEKFFLNICIRQPDIAVSTFVPGLVAAASAVPSLQSDDIHFVCRTHYDRVSIFRLLTRVVKHCGPDRCCNFFGDASMAFLSILRCGAIHMHSKRLRILLDFGIQLGRIVSFKPIVRNGDNVSAIVNILSDLEKNLVCSSLIRVCSQVRKSLSSTM